jgi:hypothetical protein
LGRGSENGAGSSQQDAVTLTHNKSTEGRFGCLERLF